MDIYIYVYVYTSFFQRLILNFLESVADTSESFQKVNRTQKKKKKD